MKRIFLSLFLAALVTVIGACTTTIAPGAPGTLQDDLGRSVNIGEVPGRIVSIGASTTEILFALGLGDRIVGCDKYSDYPPETAKMPKVDAFSSPATITEIIVGWEPDIVFALWYSVPDWVTSLENHGVPVFLIAPKGVHDILSSIELLGKATRTEERSTELTVGMQKRIKAVTDATAGSSRPKVFYEIDGTDPTKPWTAGPGSFVDDLIRLAGGENVAGTGPSEGFQMTVEAILDSDPDVVLLGDVLWGTTPESVAVRPGWSKIKAVKDGHVYGVNSDMASRAGPRIVEALEEFARLIHPELFK
ncbi:MAG: helical backbone metal receptor [Chloroflexota bacterium]